MKLLRQTLTLTLLIAFLLESFLVPTAVSAAFIPLECISGECEINVFGQDKDFNKIFPESKSSVRLRVSPKLFRAPEATEDSFSYRAYEINGLGQKEVISKTYVKFPKNKKNNKDYQLDLPLKPFTGSKTIYIEWYASNDKLLLTNSLDLSAEGVFASNLAQSVNPNFNSVQETVMDFLVNNVRWNTNPRGDSKSISVIPDNRNNIVEVNIPVGSSRNGVAVRRRKKLKYGSNNGVDFDSQTLNTNSDDNNVSTDSPIIVQDGKIMALTSSQDPSVPILVIDSNRRLGINESTPQATLDIAPGDNTEELPIMRFRPSPLPGSLTEGAFEFDNSGDLYFTSNNVRRNFVFNPDGDDSVKKLQSSTDTTKFTTYTGNFNTVLNAQAELTSLNLPAANGTIARLEDLTGLTPGSGTVNTNELADGSVTNPKLAPDAVTTDKILDGTITSADLDSGLLNSLDEALRLKSSSVGATTEAITFEGLTHNAKFILNGASTADVNLTLPEGDGTLARLSDITSPGAGSIGTNELADASVTNPKLAPNAVTTDKILDGTVQTVDLADASVTNPKLAPNAVTTDKILDGTILGIDIAPNTLTGLNIFDGSVNTVDLAPNSVTTDKISDGHVTVLKLADDSVNSDKVIDNSLTADDLADGSVSTNEILDGTITSADLDSGLLNSLDEALRLKSSSVGATTEAITFEGLTYNAKFVLNGASTADVNLTLPEGDGTLARLSDLSAVVPGPGSVTNVTLADNSVTTNKIVDGTILTVDLADGSVTNPKLAPDAVTTDKILDGEVMEADLADDSVNSAKVVDESLTGDDILDGSITIDDLAPGTIGTGSLADGSVTNPKLAPNSVTTNKILDGEIMEADLADSSVTTAKIADGSVTNVKLANNAVTTDKILDGTISSADLAPGTIIAASLADESVTNPKLAPDAVTTDKILDGTIQIADLDPSEV